MGLAHFANARSTRNALDRVRLRSASRLFAHRGLPRAKADLVAIEGEDIRGNGYAVAAFGLVSLELLEAIAAASERSRSPVILSKIPGVRRVVTGCAVTQTPRYRYCWLVEFAHEKAAANYRDHPDQLAFASCLPRPIAPERISIDFAQVG